MRTPSDSNHTVRARLPHRDVQLYWLLWRAGLKASRAFVPPTVLDMLVLQGAAFIVGAIQVGAGVRGWVGLGGAGSRWWGLGY